MPESQKCMIYRFYLGKNCTQRSSPAKCMFLSRTGVQGEGCSSSCTMKCSAKPVHDRETCTVVCASHQLDSFTATWALLTASNHYKHHCLQFTQCSPSVDLPRTTHEKYLLLKICFPSCTDQPGKPNKLRSVSGKENNDL